MDTAAIVDSTELEHKVKQMYGEVETRGWRFPTGSGRKFMAENVSLFAVKE